MSQVAVLFARKDSIYKHMRDCDVFDEERDARIYRGDMPVIAHPPCRLWSRMRKFSRAPESEKKLALFAVDEVRRCGGVLEHPAGSLLWKEAGLPAAGKGADAYGGWTLNVLQFWWGHKAAKNTWLYIVGISPRKLPPMDFLLGEPQYMVSTSRGKSKKPEISKADRERTPPRFAEWLFDLALKTKQGD